MHCPVALVIGLEVDFVRSIFTILIWTIVVYFINRWLWKKGLKQYSGMGA